MSETFPKSFLIFGDSFLCKNNISQIKKKYPKSRCITFSASKDSLDSIRAECGTSSWDDSNKTVLIQDLPNKKQVRDFIIDICGSHIDTTTVIVWDSTNFISVDPQTKTFNKTCHDFISQFKKIKDAMVINNGQEFTHKNEDDCTQFVVKNFAKYKKSIDDKSARLFINIIGYDRGMLLSDIEKISLLTDDIITPELIIEHAFPSSKEAVLYKINNVLNTGSYENSINMIERFIACGIHPAVLSEIMVKKARWQLAAVYFWKMGLPWSEIVSKLMSMGKFPSFIWHNPLNDQKNKDAENYQGPEGIYKYVVFRYGIPKKYLRINEKAKTNKEANVGKSETIPFSFQAEQIVDFVKNKIVIPNKSLENAQERIFDKVISTYSFILSKMMEIRYGENQIQDLQEMVRALTNLKMV